MAKRMLGWLLVFIMLLSTLVACENKEDDTVYTTYDKYDNPLADTDVGGSDILSVSEDDKTITLENEKVRIIFHKGNGSIKEYVNKETKQYLVRDAAANTPFTANYFTREVNNGKFSYTVSNDTDDLKELEFTWIVRGETKLITHARLEKGGDTISFDVAIEGNNPEDYISSVEYPVFNGITELYADGSRDQFVSPVATGFLFYNPATSFNHEDYNFRGITKLKGLYPAGFEYSMQFMAYITENIGGFYIATNDGGSTIKSFTFTGVGGNKLRASVHHYLDDTAAVNVEFDYEIQVANLTKGYWQEAGDRYFRFAKDQDWMKMGRLENRDDINKELFEETVLCNFGILGSDKEAIVDGRKAIYDLYSETISGKMLNIYHCLWYQTNAQDRFQTDWDSFFPAKIDEEFLQYIKDQGDQVQFFEFNTIFNRKYPGDLKKYPIGDWAMKSIYNDRTLFTSSAGYFEYWYMCPTQEAWLEYALEKDRELLETYGLDGLYHDVGTAAATPPQCYNKDHAHGTFCNMIEYFVEQERQAYELAKEYGVYSVGQELIYEQLLPYVEYYQSRGNGDLLGSMESDDFREVIASNEAVKVPLFDYVYHAYGGLRIDGFVMPYEEGLELIEALPDAEALWSLPDGTIKMSSGMDQYARSLGATARD